MLLQSNEDADLCVPRVSCLLAINFKVSHEGILAAKFFSGSRPNPLPRVHHNLLYRTTFRLHLRATCRRNSLRNHSFGNIVDIRNSGAKQERVLGSVIAHIVDIDGKWFEPTLSNPARNATTIHYFLSAEGDAGFGGCPSMFNSIVMSFPTTAPLSAMPPFATW